MTSTFGKFAGAILGLTFGFLVSGLAIFGIGEGAWSFHNTLHPPLTLQERMVRLYENAPICKQVPEATE